MEKILTREQFTALAGLAVGGIADISEPDVMESLRDIGCIMGDKVTGKGYDVLEPYRAKRAVFIAAGFGSRLVPITLNTPKPLIRVRGKRIIDGLIDACLAVGIREIYIVRGYLGEQFDQLLYKYPMVKFIENPYYGEANNISSAMLAGCFLQDAYVFEADLLVSNPEIISKYHYTSNYLGIKKGHTDDWCFLMKDGVIDHIGIGGDNCYQEVGISYWDAESGRKLEKHLKQAYGQLGGRQLYWDQVPLEKFKNEYHVEVRECSEDDITEIDTFSELKAVDKEYDT